jgi:hypothetical protein
VRARNATAAISCTDMNGAFPLLVADKIVSKSLIGTRCRCSEKFSRVANGRHQYRLSREHKEIEI